MTTNEATARVERVASFDLADELAGCPTIAEVASRGFQQIVSYVRTHVASGNSTVDKIAVRSQTQAEQLINRWNAASCGWTYRLS